MKKVILFLICISVFLTNVCFAADKTVSLQWDHNQDADYYIVYWGTEPGTYTKETPKIVIPTQTADILITDVVEDQTYYFAVKAYNEYGNSSDFSQEVSVKYGTRIPEIPTGVKAWWKVLISWMQNLFASVS